MRLNRFIVLLSYLALLGCPNNGGDPKGIKPAHSAFVGRVLLGSPVVGASLDARQIQGGDRIAAAVSGEQGAFSLDTQIGADFQICATAGTYVEPATGTTTSMGSATLCTARFDVQDAVHGVYITPLSHLAVVRAKALVQQNLAWDRAHRTAVVDINGFFACSLPGVDLLSVDPRDPTNPQEAIGGFSPGLAAGLVAAGFSEQAKLISETQGLAPGTRVTAASLISALAEDLEDGILDGRNARGPVTLQGFELNDSSMRSSPQGFVQGLRRFLESPRNVTGLRPNDLKDWLTCLSQNAGPLFGGRSGGVLDMTPPGVTITAPLADTTIAHQVTVQCSARDEGTGVDAATFSLWAQAPGSTQRLNTPTLSGGGDDAAPSAFVRTRTVQWNTSDLPDGGVEVYCSAQDKAGNATTAVTRVVVNNHGPQVEAVVPKDSTGLSGIVSLECLCHAPAELKARCTLDSPVHGVTLSPASTADHLWATWDTRVEFEGDNQVICIGASRDRDPVVLSVPVLVNNWPIGKASGTVFADSPVKNVVVEAFAYNNAAERGKSLGRTYSRDGRFEMDIDDTYAGPILFEARRSDQVGALTSFRSAVFEGAEIPLFDSKITLLWGAYRAPHDITNLSLSLASSWAEAFTTALLQHKPAWLGGVTEVEAVANTAHLMVARHLRAGDPVIDVRTTPVRNLAERQGPFSELIADESTLLGLFHAGLSELGAEIAVADKASPTSLASTNLLDLVRRDLSDGVLDGRDKDGKTIHFPTDPTHAVSSELLRGELAAAIRRWLDNVPLSENVAPPRNVMGLRTDNYKKPGGFLEALAADASQVFDPQTRPPVYDLAGPDIVSVSFFDASGRVLDTRRPFTGIVTVAVSAYDASGIESLAVGVGDTLLPLKSVDENHIVATFATPNFQDGTIDLVIRAVDKFGNHSTDTRTVQVDNTQPRIDMTQDVPRWTNGHEPVRLVSHFNKPMVAVSITSPHGAPYERRGVGITDIDEGYTIACPAESTITIAATDALGRVAYKQLDIICDNVAPVVTLRRSFFRQERAGLAPSYTEAPDVRLEWNPRGDVALVDLSQLAFPPTPGAGEPPTLEKFYNRLDYLPQAGLDEQAQNLPTFVFSAHDNATPAESIQVAYRYVFNGAVQRDWQPLQPASGLYRIPVSYQTLLPSPLVADIEQGQRQNFIARSSRTDTHTIEVQVTDLAGNVTVRPYTFHLDLMSPPVTLRHCHITDALHNLNMPAQNVHLAYTQRPFRVSIGQMQWQSTLPAGSLAPRDGLHVRIGGGTLSSTLMNRKLTFWIESGGQPSRYGPCSEGSYNNGCIIWRDGFTTPTRITYRQNGPQRNAEAPNYTYQHAPDFLFEQGNGTPGTKIAADEIMLNGSAGYHLFSTIADELIGANGAPVRWAPTYKGYMTTRLQPITWVEGGQMYAAHAEENPQALQIKTQGFALDNGTASPDQRLPPASELQIDAECRSDLSFYTAQY